MSKPNNRWFVILLPIGIVALAVSIALPSLNRWRELRSEKDYRACSWMLARIGGSMLLYSQAHGGRTPDALERLSPYLGEAPLCHRAAREGFVGVPGAAAGSYIYAAPPGILNDVKDAAATVAACEPPTCHHAVGIHVLYMDGHVNWLDAPEARHVLAELRAGHNPPRAR